MGTFESQLSLNFYTVSGLQDLISALWSFQEMTGGFLGVCSSLSSLQSPILEFKLRHKLWSSFKPLQRLDARGRLSYGLGRGAIKGPQRYKVHVPIL